MCHRKRRRRSCFPMPQAAAVPVFENVIKNENRKRRRRSCFPMPQAQERNAAADATSLARTL